MSASDTSASGIAACNTPWRAESIAPIMPDHQANTIPPRYNAGWFGHSCEGLRFARACGLTRLPLPSGVPSANANERSQSMRWEQIEFILKGVYLGLLLVVALEAPEWWQVGIIALYTVGTLALCLGAMAILKLREGYRVRGRLLGFILFLILENPVLVYGGVLGGLGLGAFRVLFADKDEEWITMLPVLGGALLGWVFWNVRQWRDRRWRFWGSLGVAVLLVA